MNYRDLLHGEIMPDKVRIALSGLAGKQLPVGMFLKVRAWTRAIEPALGDYSEALFKLIAEYGELGEDGVSRVQPFSEKLPDFVAKLDELQSAEIEAALPAKINLEAELAGAPGGLTFSLEEVEILDWMLE